MSKLISCSAIAVLVCGCGHQTVVAPAAPNGITIVSKPEDIPRFKREYKFYLNSRNLSVTITASTFLGFRYSGEIDQPNGKWVLFDPESPAEKILDREILPEIETRCREIIEFDKQWRSDKPVQFVDESGQIWARKL